MNIKHIAIISGYFLAISIPLILTYFLEPSTEEGFIAQLGMLFGLCGIMMVFFQFIISARIKWIDRLFAYNNLIYFHRKMGVWAFLFIVIHFIMLTISEQSLDMLLGFGEPWYINLGKITFLILTVQILVGIGHELLFFNQ